MRREWTCPAQAWPHFTPLAFFMAGIQWLPSSPGYLGCEIGPFLSKDLEADPWGLGSVSLGERAWAQSTNTVPF